MSDGFAVEQQAQQIAEPTCDCPRAAYGEHYNECTDEHPWLSSRRITDKTLTLAAAVDEVKAGRLTPAEAYCAAIGEPVAAGTTAPAGIVRIAGEELLEAIESEEDIVKANQELLEGRALTDEESKRWQRLVSEIQRECNKRLKAKGIVLLAGCPEPNGLGFVLTGCDAKSIEAAERGFTMPSEDYCVTVTLPARERVDIARTEREDFVRRFIDLICSECIEQQAVYRAKQGFFN